MGARQEAYAQQLYPRTAPAVRDHVEGHDGAIRLERPPTQCLPVEEMNWLADNGAMRIRALVFMLVTTIVAQSCWAIGEWLHSHEPHQAPLAGTSVNADLHCDGPHDEDRSWPVESERDHHHSCFAHSPFALPLYQVTVTVATDAFSWPFPIHRISDVPSQGIDRPSWRSPA